MKDYSNYHVQSSDKMSHDAIELFNLHLTGYEGYTGTIDGVQSQFLIQKHVSQANEFKETSKIACLSSVVLNRGSIVEESGIKYIVVSDVNDNGFYKDAEIQKSTNTLSYYSNESPFLWEIPCIVGDRVALSTNETKYISTVSNEMYLTVPNTNITRQIKPSEIYRIGLHSYSISSVGDDVSAPGLIIFKVVYSETEQSIPVFAVNILNPQPLSTDTSTPVQLNTQVLKDSVVLSPTPSLIFKSSNELVATVDNTGSVTPISVGNVTISVSLESNPTITDSISIDIVEVPVVETYTIELTGSTIPDTEIKSGSTMTFTAVKKNSSGVVVDGALFDFNVVAGSTPSSAYMFTTLSDNQCSIKCNSYTYYIDLVATDRSDNTLTVSKHIKLRALF